MTSSSAAERDAPAGSAALPDTSQLSDEPPTMAEILCEVMAQRDRMRDALEAIHASVVALPPFAVAMGIESICRHALRDAP